MVDLEAAAAKDEKCWDEWWNAKIGFFRPPVERKSTIGKKDSEKKMAIVTKSRYCREKVNGKVCLAIVPTIQLYVQYAE